MSYGLMKKDIFMLLMYNIDINSANYNTIILKLILTEDWYNPLSWDWKGAGEKVYNWGKDTVKGTIDWTKEQAKQIKQKGLLGYAKDKASAVWNSVKDAVSKAWKCLTNNFRVNATF